MADPMYPAKSGSPSAFLTDGIDALSTTMQYDADVLNTAPNVATLGTGATAEVVKFTGKTATTITGCTRGFSGTTAKAWPVGTPISRRLTSYDHDTFIDNINDITPGAGIVEADITFDPVAGHSHDGTDSTQVSAGNVLIDSIGTSIDSVQELFQHTLSAGALEPTTITPDGVAGTVDILGYKAIFRTSDDQLAPIVVANVPAVTGLAVPEGISYIVAQYNAGTPTTSIVTDYSTISFNDAFIQGRCCKDGADLCTIVSGMHVYNYPYRDIRRLQETRALEQASGLAMSNPSDFYLKITPGVVYSNFERFTIPAFDSSGTDTFSHVYKNDLGTFTRVDNLTQLNAYYYVGASGIPTAIGQNQFSVFWVYSRLDGKVIVQYGTNAFNSQSAAEASPIPEAPPKFASMVLLIGQIVCKRSESQMFSMRSAFIKKFIPAPVVTHNSLSGMQGGDVDEYYHASQAIAGGWTLNNVNATVDPTTNEDTGDGYSVGSEWVNVTDNKTFVCTDATSTSAVWEQTNASGGGSGLPAIVAGDAGKGLAVKSDESDGEWVHAKRTIFLSGAGGWASTTAGDDGVTQIEHETNDVDIAGTLFKSVATAAYHQYTFIMPANYDGGTLTAQFYWTSNATSPTGNVVWGIQGRAYADDDALDGAWGTVVKVTDGIIAKDDLHISSVSDEITLANTPAGGKMIQMRVQRDGTDVADTSSNDVVLLGVLMSYGTDNYSDV